MQTSIAQNLFDYKNYTIDEGLPSSSIISISQDERGFVLINTKGGTVKFDGYEFENIESIKDSASNPKNIKLNTTIHSFFKDKKITSSINDSQGSIWVGTERSGLFYIPNYEDITLQKTNEKVYHFLKQEDSIKYIYEKRKSEFLNIENKKIKELINTKEVNAIKTYNNLIFIATNKGVFQFDVSNPDNYNVITKHNGLPSNEIFDIEILNNNLYVATQKGVAIIKLNNRTIEDNKSTVIFPYVRLNNEKHLFPSDKIIVQPENKFLTLKYVSLDYKAKGDLLYKYKIEGIHDDWVVTNDTKIQFTSLPQKGEYVFKVKVKEHDNKWSQPSVIRLVFIEYFYESNWFLAICVLSALLTVGFIIRWMYLKNIKNQKLKAELLKLENSALQSQMNPHFVFNALNSIQSFITTGNSLKSEIYLAKFSNLLRKTLNSSRLSEIELSAEIESLTMYLELEKLRFGDKLSYKLNVEDSIEVDIVKIPPMLIQPFVENAIIHGISPKTGPGEVNINFKLISENELYCTIIDNGVGRQNKTNAAHKSLGTKIVKKRLSIISSPKEEFIKYIDLIGKNNEPLGTKVEFIIPV